jgi:dipeptidyl aminopeptidase/acylaminoacyl peptidase
MPATHTAPYGSWRSPITSDLIVAESFSLLDVLLDGDDVYWLEGRPREAGRYVLVRRGGDGRTEDVNPAPFNARTRVHEYGGGAAAGAGGVVYSSNFADQRLYRLARGAEPVPLTPAGAWRYADGLIDTPRRRWVGVLEDHSDPGREAVNTLVAIDLDKGGPGEVLASGSDFYSSPRLSPDGRRLAWLSWRHPNMPWDGTELWQAEVAADGSLTGAAKVAGGERESAFQPEWSPDGRLYFISDRSGWWNLYRDEGGTAVALCPRAAEFGEAQWTFGMSTYAFLSAERLVCAYSERGLGRLAVLDLRSGDLTPFDLPYTSFASVRARGDRVAFRAGSPAHPTSVVVLPLNGAPQVLRTATPLADDPALNRYFSRPEAVEFPTEGGKTAFGLYYPPFNPDYAAPEGEKPPLVVKCHGGPTSAASSTLDLRTQYWTSRGIAVLDVNYGGSTGFGREYRERLNGQWGVVDVDDCVNGAKFLAGRGAADERRAVITGGSAGGYTTLAALTFRDYFRGGASHYGVSDAEALARDTHKFESRYLDGLIGPYPAAQALYRERSPICHADRLNAPVTFFQGDEDRIVPPDQTERMVEALRRKGIPVGYLLFAGEQHGFRQGGNIRRALDAELYFYAALVFRTGLSF